MIDVLLWSLIGYLSGSILYSKLIATYVLKIDISQIGDGNPGTTNVAKVGGAKWAATAFFLDVLKGAVPVAIAHFALGMQDWRIIPIAIAPAVGHAYPIFFGFKGGKGIATVGGGWVGIATWEMITVGSLFLLFWYRTVRESAWVTVFMVLSTAAYIIVTGKPNYWIGFIFVNLAFLAWTHRHDLPNSPGVQPWVKNLAGRIWRPTS